MVPISDLIRLAGKESSNSEFLSSKTLNEKKNSKNFKYSQTSLKQTPLAIAVHLQDVFAYERLKNTKHHRG